MSTINSDILANLFSVLSTKIIVPGGFQARTAAVKTMLSNDIAGLVDSLTDFSVSSASVDFTIETESGDFTKILKKWLDSINAAYMGKIPSGINALSEEYFKERWKSSSFPILKIADWTSINGILVPSKMFIVDGESVYAIDKNKDTAKTLLNYDYYLGKGKKNKLDENVIFTRPYGRWFDKYPNPYLIKRGVYHNWKIIESLKNKQTTVLDQVIPYLFLIKKGSELLDRDGITYQNEDLKKVVEQYKTLMKNVEAGKTPTRASSWDEELKHLIPDLKNIFEPALFAVAEKSILSGLGFIDVIEATSSSRKESILNPKVFIEETKKGVKDFKQLLREIVNLIIAKNKSHKKYMNLDFRIVNSPKTAFMTNEFKNNTRLLWERGQLSNQTYCELVGEVEYATEVGRREKEKNTTEKIMTPHQTQVFEQTTEENNPIEKEIDKKGKPIPTDKTDDPKKYKNASIVEGKKVTLKFAPYRQLSELPNDVKKLSNKKQRTFMKAFNRAYYFQIGKGKSKKFADAYAFRVAYSAIKPKKKK